jgi:ERCC4-related helicase
MQTPYHAKYFAHELTKRCPSDSVAKLAASLADAQVDLNPHQIDAALFAFRSPLSKGAILADEVGLGKTIEAGILISQKWAEQKRRLLIIVPANLRKQWSQELADKFFLPSVILEAKSFNASIKSGNLNPFEQKGIIICSYHFARSKDSYLKMVSWDLVIADEAHRLRNVYRPQNRIANAIKNAIAHAPKVLLTATPLQNTLQELYGLVSIVDELVFGDLKSFKSQFCTIRTDADYQALRERLKTVCQRTLRRQVLEYIRYTNRIPITQEFVPTPEEQRLYNLVSDYLLRGNLYALPSGQRKLMTLILRKLLASSTYAISGTLGALSERLEAAAREHFTPVVKPEEVSPDYETIDEIEDELSDDQEGTNEKEPLTSEQLAELEQERQTLIEFKALADSIVKNSKGEALMAALRSGFAKAQEFGAPQKAIIFTESTRTQKYLLQVLEATTYCGKVVLFNGNNNDPRSREIYKAWMQRHQGTDRVTGSPTADMRAALVDYFREEATIMVATEAAAEGINLQFCSLVVNYDLPWNPQRIEQRIGRCHRYGQKHDVVVVNFLNKNNAADQRVYELLKDKFQLFSGVFGASDEVLGSIESGVDFETRIAAIYQSCRSSEEIAEAFNTLQSEMEEQIDERMRDTRRKLLENFDEEVQEKLRVQLSQSTEALSRYEQWLWALTRYCLQDSADFSEDGKSFHLISNPFPGENIHLGPYRVGKHVEDANLYRIGHPLAQRIITHCRELELPPAELRFDYSGTGRNIAALDSLRGASGWLAAHAVTVTAFETQDYVLLLGNKDDGTPLLPEQCQRLFTLSAEAVEVFAEAGRIGRETLEAALSKQRTGILENLSAKNATYFEAELDKLDRWGEDQRATLKLELKELEDRIKEVKRSARTVANLPAKLKLERERRQLDAKRDAAWKEYELAAREIEAKKDMLMDEVERRLQQQVNEQELFTLRWSLS